jgi:DHA3 family macrolide efflux protein-like MFS transporter
MQSEQRNWAIPFFTIWTGQALSLTGSRIAMFALVWWLTDTTGSATVLATGTLMAMLPQIVLGPIAGAYVDRWNRRNVMIVADSAIALVSLWLAYLFWAGSIEVWHVYVIMLARELGGIFHWPAMQASTSLMVPKHHLARVSGVNQAMNGGLNIVGPALGALLLSVAAIHSIMLLDVATAAFAIAPLFVIAIPQPDRQDAAGNDPAHTSIWGDVRDGLRYVLQWRGLMVITVMAMVFKIALTPAFSLLPLLVTDHFGGEAKELAGLEMMFGVGVILGGIALGVWGGFKRQIFTTLTALTAAGTALIVLGFLPDSAFPVALGLLFLVGAFVAMVDGPIFAVLQKTIAPEMQGRVFMLFVSLVTITSPIGLAVAGPVTDRIGIQVWYIVAGALSAAMALWAMFIPAVVHLEDYQYQADTAAIPVMSPEVTEAVSGSD